MPVAETWKTVGGKIRQLRKANQLTIRQLAQGCDLSANAISLVERGEVAPSVATLCKIAHALGVSASSLFREVCSPEVVLQRASEAGSEVLVDRCLAEVSCNLQASEHMQPETRSKRAKSSIDEPPEIVRQSVLCLCGGVTFEVDEQTFCLEPGDQLSFNGEAFHRWRNGSALTGVAILILPPNDRRI